MPTPESAAFLAKKPTVPPTFDGVDYDDPKRVKQAQDAIIREQWVRVMMGRLVREELSKCYYREGVNHLEKCGHLRGGYRVLRILRWFFFFGGRTIQQLHAINHAVVLFLLLLTLLLWRRTLPPATLRKPCPGLSFRAAEPFREPAKAMISPPPAF
ncbi:hypothetical protein QBC45DRAFT_420182 [Copromyces sp. CBS 386.78]|nr:hypothetical protein QBC45DRAFT_420182 [Copromyces sp. CBS 386.78]